MGWPKVLHISCEWNSCVWYSSQDGRSQGHRKEYDYRCTTCRSYSEQNSQIIGCGKWKDIEHYICVSERIVHCLETFKMWMEEDNDRLELIGDEFCSRSLKFQQPQLQGKLNINPIYTTSMITVHHILHNACIYGWAAIHKPLISDINGKKKKHITWHKRFCQSEICRQVEQTFFHFVFNVQ